MIIWKTAAKRFTPGKRNCINRENTVHTRMAILNRAQVATCIMQFMTHYSA